jgi:hypothetical protein
MTKRFAAALICRPLAFATSGQLMRGQLSPAPAELAVRDYTVTADVAGQSLTKPARVRARISGAHLHRRLVRALHEQPPHVLGRLDR